jgi:cytochrome c553
VNERVVAFRATTPNLFISCEARDVNRIASLLALAFFGCSSPSPASPEADGGAAANDTGSEVTYYADVRPILARECTSCHTSGGVGFPLDSYEAAKPRAALLASATASRRMPPFLADNSGSCNTYSNARWLSDAEIATLASWAAAGAPEGDPTTPPPTPVAPVTLEGQIATLDSGFDYAPNTNVHDDYRCFVVEAPSASDYSVVGYEVAPGNIAIVHHVIVYAPASDADANAVRAADAAESGPGYTCYGGPGADAFPVVLFAPGAGPTKFPSGTGVGLTGGRPLVMQIHYNLLAGSGADRTRVDLALAQSSVAPAYIVPVGDYRMRVAPRMESVSTSATQRIGVQIPIRVFGAFPHMHTLGRELNVTIEHADASEACLVQLPRWDFNWQMAYWYSEPITIQPTDSARITCTYDTRSRTDFVTWGEGTEDEMCLSYFYVSI